MGTLLDVLSLIAITLLCWQGYHKRQLWLYVLAGLIGRLYQGKSFMWQLLGFGPLIVIWLLFCHWLNTQGMHATAAGGILLAMTLALQSMRALEEKQKWEKEQCDTYD